MSRTPLVTIITVTFNPFKNNRKRQLEQCIKSVHNQDYKNIEHLVIDGNSTDGTKEFLNKYQELNWIRYISEHDSGIYDAMNKGVNLSKGKYVAFLNSDDYYDDNQGIKNSIMQLESEKADFSYAPVTNLDSKRHLKEILVPDIKTVFFNIVPNHQTMIFKKDILIKEGLFDTKFKCVGDYDMTVRLCLKKYKSTFIRENFSTYRLGGFSEKATNDGTVLKEIVEIYFRNYNKICNLSKNECRQIVGELYNGKIYNIPPKLAVKLADNKQYFDLYDYINSINNKYKEFYIQTKHHKDHYIFTKTEVKIVMLLRKTKYLIIPENSYRKHIFDLLFHKLK